MGTVTTGSFDEIQDDLGGSNPISLSEYYRAGSYVPNTVNNAGVPKSGAISVADISSVDGGTGANDTALTYGGTTSASTSTGNKTGCDLSTSYTFACAASTSWTQTDGDGNTPSNATITWSGSGISFSGSGTSVTATVTSSSSYNTTSNFTATATGNGGTTASFSFSVQTKHDVVPDDLGSASDTGVNLSTTQYGSSNEVSGLTTSVTATFSGNGGFSVNSSPSPSGTYSTASKTVQNGNYIHIRQTASGSYSTTTTGTVSIFDEEEGGDDFVHTVSTRAQDTQPSDLTLASNYNITGAALSTTYTTGSYTLNGVDSDVTATITSGGTNGIGISDTSLTNGETSTFTQTSSSSPRTTITGTATISGLTGMTQTVHSGTVRTGDYGLLGTGGGIEYSPSYGYYGNCTQWMCPWVAKYTITRTLKIVYQSSGTPYIAMYLYDTISDTAGTQISATDGSQWVWHSTYYLGDVYSDIDAGDTFKVKWSDSTDIFPTSGETFSGWANGSGSGSGTSRIYTSGNLTLGDIPYSDGTTSNMAVRTRTYSRGCECYSCFGNDDDNNEPYSVWLENVSGTTILPQAPGSGSTRCRLTATTTYSGMCF